MIHAYHLLSVFLLGLAASGGAIGLAACVESESHQETGVEQSTRFAPFVSVCIENRLNGQYLSDKALYWHVCDAGEKWSSINVGNGMVCIRNDLRHQIGRRSYLSDKKIYDPTMNDSFLFNETCEAGEYWVISEQGDGSVCVKNNLNGKFLSDKDSAPFHDVCGEGERFMIQQ